MSGVWNCAGNMSSNNRGLELWNGVEGVFWKRSGVQKLWELGWEQVYK